MQKLDIDLSDWRPLSLFGARVIAHAAPIRGYLSRHLTAEQLRLLAHPAENGDQLEWFAHQNGTVTPLSDLSVSDRDAAQTAYFETTRKIEALIEEISAYGAGPDGMRPSAVGRHATSGLSQDEARRLARLLGSLRLVPDSRLVFVQDGLPIRAGWGGDLDNAELFDDPSRRPPPTPHDEKAPRGRPLLGALTRSRIGDIETLTDAQGQRVVDDVQERLSSSGVSSTAGSKITLMWENSNDLDLALILPDGSRVYFGNKQLGIGGSTVELDIDMNASKTGPAFNRYKPVENITVGSFDFDGAWGVQVTHFAHRIPAPLSCRFRVALQLPGMLRFVEGRLAPGDMRQVATIIVEAGDIVAVDTA